MSTIDQQPKATPRLSIRPVPDDEDQGTFQGDGDGTLKLPSLKQIKHKIGTREGWLGSYDFGYLCMPTLPFSVGKFKRRAK